MDSKKNNNEVYKNERPETTRITTTISIGESDSSISLSLTPPSLDDGGKNAKTVQSGMSEESISEHLSSEASNIENDRSLQEIEIDNFPNYSHDFVELSEGNVRLSQETKPSLSLPTESNGNISLNSFDADGVVNKHHGEIKSILEEILNNEQFLSGSETLSKNSREDSFDIFANLDLEDRSLTERLINQMTEENEDNSKVDEISKQVHQLEQLLEVKDQTIEALNNELDSLKEAVSNPSTLSMGTSTEYKQLSEEYHTKLIDYCNAIEQKDDLIMQLTESLKQSIEERKELKDEVDHFKNELEYLHKQLEHTSQMLLKVGPESNSVNLALTKEDNLSILLSLGESGFETECLKLEGTLSSDQIHLLKNIKNTVNKYVEKKLKEQQTENENTMAFLKNSIQEEKLNHNREVEGLKDLLANMKNGSAEILKLRQELEEKHKKEMEELRRYFEQKCTDLEKNYSEEIFSHNLRKRSGSSSSSEGELPPGMLGLRSRPGPGGDAASSLESYKVNYKKRALHNLSKTDLMNLKQDLKNMLDIFDKIDIESSSNEDVSKMKEELGDYDVRNLFKIEMEAFRNEMKNKYHAELEILSQDYENKVDLLKIQQEEKLKCMRDKYNEEIENLKEILNKTNKSVEYSSAIQEVGSSGDFEINEVVESYERRLQEQVRMAKIDIIAALENQIQRLAANVEPDEDWPQELLTLRNRFTEKYEQKIADLQSEHEKQISKLKEEHIKNLNGALERARRRSLRDGDSLSQLDAKVIEERNNFKKQASLLRDLLSELLKYFTQCEDEVNNTIVDELVRQASEKNITDIEKELNDSSSSIKTDSSSSTIKRVHLAPKFKDLISIIENSSEKDSESADFSADLKNELESCLEKLRLEANAVLALSINVSRQSEGGESVKNVETEDVVAALNQKLKKEMQFREKLSQEIEGQRNIIDSLEKERSVLEGQVIELIERLNVTQTDLEMSQMKISELLENGQREIISEGYGGNTYRGELEGFAAAAFNKLQERARTILVGSHSHDPALLHLLEDLVTVGERVIEESKVINNDLQQQIDVADKKYKQTCKFLEEQAADREMERDDFHKQILALQEQHKNLEKGRASFENINEEVERLELQLRECKRLCETKDQKLSEIEAERNEAVDKVCFLRTLIQDLETQIKVKTDNEADLRTLLHELESLISQQNRGSPSDRVKSPLSSENFETQELKDHVRALEAEVQKLRLSQELVGSEGALREVRNQLVEIEAVIDKKTKELEEQSSVTCTTTCSSPSEDMSVRDVVRPKTPTSMAINDSEIPLQQLARLKEKLIRHARAEDAALKRIRDLEMQVFNLKVMLEEHQTEKEILKKEIADQLVVISSLQIRLDDQRIRAEHIEKQTNSSLESRIYDLEKEIADLQESLENRNKTVDNLNGLVDELKRKIEEKESEIDTTSEDEMIITMQREIEHLRNQNELLHKRLNSGVDIIPNLVENIISDKNSDIESLKQKLDTVEKQLEMFNSLNLDKSQISVLKNLKSSGTSLSEVLSIIELSSPEQVRRMTDSAQDTFSGNSFSRRRKDDTLFLSPDDVSEISCIPNVGKSEEPLSSLVTPLGRKNSTEIKSSDRRVHFDFSAKKNNQIEIDNLVSELDKVKIELAQKDEIIKDCNERLQTLTQLETNIDFVQTKLEETQNTLKDVTGKFEQEISNREDKEKDLRVELVQKKMYLEEKERQLQLLIDDAKRKDEMYLNLAKEMKNLKREKESLIENLTDYKDVEEIMSVKNKMILELEEELGKLRSKDSSEGVEFENRLKANEEECESLKLRLDSFSKENQEKDQLIGELEAENEKLTGIVKIEIENGEKLRKDLKNKEKQIEEMEKEFSRMKRQVEILENEKVMLMYEMNSSKAIISQKENELSHLQNELSQNCHELEEAQGELNKLKSVILKNLEEQILSLQNENTLKAGESDKLRVELKNLQDLITTKDRIIAQFKRDSEQLQVNLSTIQNKMKEAGNILDLGKKLRDEQMRNSELIEEIQKLKAQLMSHGILDRDVPSLEEIAGKVREELDYSAQIDSNIINATEDIDSAEELQETLLTLKNKYKELNKKFNQEVEKTKIVEGELERKQFELDAIQLEDANLIEQLRIELEAAGENEIELENVAESWRKRCEIFEIEIARLKTQLSNTNSKTESTEYKELPTKESKEISRYKGEIAKLNEEVFGLKEEVKKLRKSKKELDSNLRYSKDILELKKREIENLMRKIEDNSKKEGELLEKLKTCNSQLAKKTQEVENSRILIDETESERRNLQQQVDRLNADLKVSQEASSKSHEPQIRNNIPIADQLMNKIEEINSAVKNDRKTMDLILRLTNDNKILKNRILELETEETVNVPLENPMNRANYLFAKCLKVESYRKALIWQKKYLISLLGSYQYTTDLGPMEKFQGGQKKIRFSGIRKFRCIVYVVLTTLRMKFIVRRWRSSGRFAENVNLRYRLADSASERGVRLGSFQIGQPVSRQQFAQSTRRSGLANVQNFPSSAVDQENLPENSSSRYVDPAFLSREREMPWSGVSPPCKDKSGVRSRLSSNLNILKAPQLVTQYSERYNKIQQNLEQLLNPDPPI